ncbi:MAG: hypothetical protein QF645_10115, partial [Planctomycetota bacterium]|nr:hypothetical protein [Planctomycetota bacterium]
ILFWGEEFKRLIQQKELYQDKFILISGGHYSNVSAEEVGLPQDEWQELSLKIRMEHESTHYMTARFFGSVRDCAFEEMVADYTGIVEAVGEFRADWFLRFMGLEDFPQFRETGRLIRYRGTPPLSNEAFTILQKMIVDAAQHIENVDRKFFAKRERGVREKALMFFALSEGCLEEWASGQLETRVAEWNKKIDSMVTSSG